VPAIELGQGRIEYSVIRGTSRRYTYFRFRPDLTLEVVVPRGKHIDVGRALRAKSAWLRREYERMSMTRNVLSRNSVMFDGRILKAVFTGGSQDLLIPDLATGELLVTTSDPRRLRELVRRWFLAESSAYVVKKVAEFAPRVGAKPSRVDVREIGKWGYCTREGRLSFSWQLAALPDRLKEYVVYHELTHLLEFNHSPSFRRKLASVCPDFRALERELDLVAPYDRLGPP
jgi:predicted metal-dependent hydrolase